METHGDQRRLWDTRAENWKKWRGTSGDLRKGQSRHRQVQVSCANVCQEEVCLFVCVAFNSGTEIWWWRQRWKSWGWGSGQRSCDEEAPVRSLSFILNTRRCHWRVLSFAGHHLGRQKPAEDQYFMHRIYYRELVIHGMEIERPNREQWGNQGW